MGRRVLSVLAVLALCLSWLPGTAAAAEDGVTVCGTPLRAGCAYTVNEGGGVGSWNDPSLENYPKNDYFLYSYDSENETATITVYGAVELFTKTSDPILSTNSVALQITGGDNSSLVLKGGDASGATVFSIGNSSSIELAGAVDFTARNISSQDPVSGSNFRTADGYMGNITLVSEYRPVISDLTITSAGNVTITGSGDPQILSGVTNITASGSVSIENEATGKGISAGALEIDAGKNVSLISDGIIGTYSVKAGGDVTLTSNSGSEPTISDGSSVTAQNGTVTLTNKATGGKTRPENFSGITANNIVDTLSIPEIDNGMMTFSGGTYGDIPISQETLTINTVSATTIGGIIGNQEYSDKLSNLTFTGDGLLTIKGDIMMGAAYGDTLALQKGAKVTVDGCISLGESTQKGSISVAEGTTLTIKCTGHMNFQAMEGLTVEKGGTLVVNGTLMLAVPEKVNLKDGSTLSIKTDGTIPALALGEYDTANPDSAKEASFKEFVVKHMVGYSEDAHEINLWPQSPASGENQYFTVLYKQTKKPVTEVGLTGKPGTVTPDPDPTPPRPTYTYYNINVEAGEGGTVTGGGRFRSGRTATLTAVPADGYAFSHWEENGTTLDADNPYTFTVTRSRTITACFVRTTYTVTVNAEEGGTVSGGGTFQAGEAVTVTAEPDEGWAFTAWTEEDETVSDAPVYTFEVDRDMTLTARFEEVPAYTVTVEAEEGGTASGGGTYWEGETATLTAVPNEGWYFVCWDDGASTLTENPYTFAVVEDRTLTACFEEKITPELSVKASSTNLYNGGTVTLTVTPDLEDVTLSCSVKDIELTAGTEHNTWTVTLPDKTADYVFTAVYPGDETHDPAEASCTVRVRAWQPSYPSYPSAPSKPSTPSTPSAPSTPTAPVEPDPAPVEPDGCDGGPGCPSRPYPDLDPSEWYHPDTDFVLEEGIMQGFEDGTFRPDERISRAMLVQTLYNYAGRPVVTADVQFSDVAADAWYAPAVSWAVSRGIVQGFEDGTFRPDAPIIREELAVMLWRYAGSPAVEDAALPFADAEKASDWALAALRWAVKQGILEGKGGGILDPQGFATRAEAAKMLRKFMEE